MDEITTLALRMARDKDLGLINLTCADVSAKAGFPEGSFVARAGYTFGELIDKLTPLLRDMPVCMQRDKGRAIPSARRDQIIKAALSVAQEKPYNTIKYTDVAACAGIARTLIPHYFIDESDLITEMLTLAIEQDILPVVKLGLLLQHPVIMAAPLELRTRANAI